MIYPNVSINGIDMLKEYQMALKDRHCMQPPEPKTLYQDVPGADGSLDLSTVVSGRIVYKRRKITMNFGCGYDTARWPGVFSEILRAFHGKVGRIIFDDDPAYYYLGRMAVSNYVRVQTFGTFTIIVDADPYKYELTASNEDWKWDEYNFETGIIRELTDLDVKESLTISIPGAEKWAIPEFAVTNDMTVDFEGKTHTLKAGTNKIYGLIFKDSENVLTFHGTGMVTVIYQGGVL